MVEHFHRQLKDSLQSRQAAADWPSHLPWVLLGLRAAAKEDSGVSSAELLYGLPLRLPPDPASRLEASMEDVTATRAALPTRPLSYAEVLQDVPSHLAGAEMVFIRVGAARPPLSPLFEGPYLVEKRGAKSFTIKIGDRLEVVPVDPLKAYHGTQAPAAAAPRLDVEGLLLLQGLPRSLSGGYVAARKPASMIFNPRTILCKIRVLIL